MRIYLQTPPTDNAPPRYYQLFLQKDLLDGWNVIREYGQQGASGRLMRAHYDSHHEAQEALLALRDAQLKKGYRVVFAQGAEPPR